MAEVIRIKFQLYPAPGTYHTLSRMYEETTLKPRQECHDFITHQISDPARKKTPGTLYLKPQEFARFVCQCNDNPGLISWFDPEILHTTEDRL